MAARGACRFTRHARLGTVCVWARPSPHPLHRTAYTPHLHIQLPPRPHIYLPRLWTERSRHHGWRCKILSARSGYKGSIASSSLPRHTSRTPILFFSRHTGTDLLASHCMLCVTSNVTSERYLRGLPPTHACVHAMRLLLSCASLPALRRSRALEQRVHILERRDRLRVLLPLGLLACIVLLREKLLGAGEVARLGEKRAEVVH